MIRALLLLLAVCGCLNVVTYYRQRNQIKVLEGQLHTVTLERGSWYNAIVEENQGIKDLKPDHNPHDPVGPLGFEPTSIASRVATALGSDPLVILEIRKQSDGRYLPVLDPERVKGIVLKELEQR